MGPILVVDDDAAVRGLMCDVFEVEGWTAEPAASVAEALVLAERQRFAAVVLDLSLVDAPERQARVGELRRLLGTVPIIVVSGSPRSVEEAREIGAAAVLRKPFEPEELVAEVQSAVGGAAPGRESA